MYFKQTEAENNEFPIYTAINDSSKNGENTITNGKLVIGECSLKYELKIITKYLKLFLH